MNLKYHTGVNAIAITRISKLGAPAPPGDDGSPPAGPRGPWVPLAGSDSAGGSAEGEERRGSVACMRRAATERTTDGQPICEADVGLDS